MSSYESHLEKIYEKKMKQRYSRQALERLTTLQLRDICYKEKLVKGIANSLDREKFIETILRFRGLNNETLIQKFDFEGYAKLENLVKNHLGEDLTTHEQIANPAKLTVYEGLAIEPRDQYFVETSSPILTSSNVLLVNDKMELCGVFTLHATDETNQRFVLCMEKNFPVKRSTNKVYHMLYFKSIQSEYIFDVYVGNERLLNAPVDYFDVPLLDLEIRELPTTNQVLAIDFGTSNSTAGVFVGSNYQELMNPHEILSGNVFENQINYVNFEVNRDMDEWSPLLPTAVRVVDCHSSQQVEYCFGHEALRDNQMAYFGNSFGTTIYELKRWVNSLDQMEQIVDFSGNTATVTRGSIIQAFIEYMISHAEQQFKCRFAYLHVSSPVKMKYQFLTMFKELFPIYKIEHTNALDEGVSVLYNTISNQMMNNSFNDGEEYQALIFDCGGGTTDLSSCTFKIEDSRIAYRLTIETTFENGDVNFGGNNLTYRILQFLKIRFADYYEGRQPINIDEWFPSSVDDCYRYVDEYGYDAFYQHFNDVYAYAEQIIPTQFENYRNQNFESYQRVKNNYYVLWNLAEKIKQQFFTTSDTWQLSIGPNPFKFISSVLADTREFKLSTIKASGRLDYVYQIPEVVINHNEIDTLIKADIYNIIKKFFEKLYESDKLQDFSIIKMTGQSCKIPLFRDALKEYIAGKNIEFRQKENPLMDLKLSCLNGSIKYLEDSKTAVIRPELINAIPEIPYTISAQNHYGQQVDLLFSNQKITQKSGFISKDQNVKEVRFYLNNEEQKEYTSFLYQNDLSDYSQVTYEQINSEFTKFIRQDDVDNIEDGEVKFFVYANENNWGFFVLPIMRQDGTLLKGKEVFYPFESEQWEVNFFDGKK